VGKNFFTELKVENSFNAIRIAGLTRNSPMATWWRKHKSTNEKNPVRDYRSVEKRKQYKFCIPLGMHP